MTKCKYCGYESTGPIGYRRTFCDKCVPDKEPGFSGVVIETEQVSTYGKVSKKRIAELDRREIVHTYPDGSYEIGRRMENGKISEHKIPSY